MKYEEIRFAWNAQADDEKQWNSLTEAEKIEWAASIAAVKARGPAPIFRPEIKRKLGNLQGKGFRIVGYALERAARQAAQEEAVALKERIARAGVEQRRALHEAVLEAREACAKVCDEVGDKMGGSVGAYDCAAAIRARTT